MNEVLIYGPIYDFTAQAFVESFANIEGDTLTCRINTDGGGPEAGWSMLAKFAEFQGEKLVKVDGKAYSTGFNFCLYADNVECLDVSQFLVHRASYGLWYEKEYMTDAERKNMDNINAKLQQAFEAKIDVAKFEALKVCKDNNITVKRLFSNDERVDVFLTADEAKKIGLVNKITKITPENASKINAQLSKLAANYREIETLFVHPLSVEKEDEQQNLQIQIQTNMTIAEFKAQHPELFAEVVGIGVTQERDRVGALMAWRESDPEKVFTMIESGESITAKATAEFQVSMAKKASLDTLTNEGEKTQGDDRGTGSEEEAKPELDAAAKNIADLTALITGKND